MNTTVKTTCEVDKISFSQLDELIFNLLFNNSQIEYYIPFDNYCEYDQRLEFKEEIRNILKHGKINIIEDKIVHTTDDLIWKLVIYRL